MHKGLTYWGYVIAGDGIDLMETMVDAIKNAPKPKNVSQLRTFPSMLNYYHCFLPDVATVLQPPVPSLKEGGEVKVAEGKAHSF